MPTAWVCNIGASVIGAPFFDWVNQRINERNANVVQEKNLAIAMDPQVAKAFHESTAVSRKCLTYSQTLIVVFNFTKPTMIESILVSTWSAMM